MSMFVVRFWNPSAHWQVHLEFTTRGQAEARAEFYAREYGAHKGYKTAEIVEATA